MAVNCYNAVLDFLGQRLLLPPQFWSWGFGNVLANADSYTDVVDLGKNSRYTLLVARKSGNTSSGEYLEIQTSINGVQWITAVGLYDLYGNVVIAKNKPTPSAPVFCVWGRPVGRYVRIHHKNGSSVQGNLVIYLAAYGGV